MSCVFQRWSSSCISSFPLCLIYLLCSSAPRVRARFAHPAKKKKEDPGTKTTRLCVIVYIFFSSSSVSHRKATHHFVERRYANFHVCIFCGLCSRIYIRRYDLDMKRERMREKRDRVLWLTPVICSTTGGVRSERTIFIISFLFFCAVCPVGLCFSIIIRNPILQIAILWPGSFGVRFLHAHFIDYNHGVRRNEMKY